MKVGILTFHLGPNHGGYLQAYCLWKYIESQGHEVEIINYKNAVHHDNETFRPWIYRRPLKLYHAWIKEKVFQKAYKALPLSKFTTNASEVDWEKYDVVVVGSDVVWDYSWERLGKDPVYFGRFGRRVSTRLISYAPSTGTVKPTDPIPEWVVNGLATFDALSVRDNTTGEMVKKACGKIATEVLDPTWLDLKFERESVAKEKILVIYAFEVSEPFKQEILKYARKHNLKIIALGYYHGWADKNLMKLGPLEWPSLMKRAEAVVAGTFHGTLYAMKMQCRFVTVLNERILTRIEKPLRISGLESRALEDAAQFESVLESEINYEETIRRLEPHVQSSRQYLVDSLKA